MVYQYPSLAIKVSKERLHSLGQHVSQKSWQSVTSPDDTWELLNHHVGFYIPETLDDLKEQIKPNLPWAEDHFLERISGIPLNPPPSEAYWPFNIQRANDLHKNTTGQFSHTYPERFWPKYTRLNHRTDAKPEEFGIKPTVGIRFEYGDYRDVINLLYNDNTTRQAYLPIWFPEDTGVVHGKRVPCTIGYHFIIRNGYLHITYYIRSCDIIRHFHNDIYMACRLVFDIIDTFKIRGKIIKPGQFNMYIVSLHCFYKERHLLKSNEK
jgi:hypothetical protein